VLGPLVCNVYQRRSHCDLPRQYKLNMFVKSPSDYVIIQKDVDCISSFMSSKLLEFNAKKCRVMLLSRKRLNSIPSPSNGVVLSQVTTCKYLGVISQNLSWKPHYYNINIICNKTRRLIGMIYRKFYRYSDPTTLN
jgi:hypothetical protein